MFHKSFAHFTKLISFNYSGYRIQFVQGGACQIEDDQPLRAAVGFVSSGAVQSTVYEAMLLFEKIKFPAASFYIDSLTPFPDEALEAFAEKVEKIVVVESDSSAALSKIVRDKTFIRPVVMVPSHGGLITAEDIFGKEDWN